MSKLSKVCILSAGIKDIDPKQGIVMGYAASFNTQDSDNDIILPGAFTKTIQEMGPDSAKPRIKHLLNHNTGQPVAVPLVLKEDSTGLYYESKVGTHALGQDFVKMVESGLITEHSIGYGVVRKTVINPDADWRDQTTHLQELKLWEFSSLTCWGANENTPLVGMKEKAASRIPLLLKALRNGTFSEATFDILEKELLFLQHAIKTDSVDTTLPEHESATTTPDAKDEGLINELKMLNAKMAISVFH
jgi:HK97 family phage prohead protease